MAATGIDKVGYTHEAIADALIAHPMASQGEIARMFGYTESWLSQIIHSDAFQVYYRRLADARGVIAVHTFIDKISGLGALAIERTAERIQAGVASERLLTDTTEMTLRALGYLGSNGGSFPPPQQQQQNIHIHVDADMLVRAREDAAKRFTVDPSHDSGRATGCIEASTASDDLREG